MGVSLLAGLMSGIGAAVQGLSFWAAFAVTAGLSVVSRALSPRPKAGGNLGGQTVTTREPAHSRKIVYGRSRIGGNIVYLESSGDDNKYLWLVIAVAGHEIDAYEEVWFNDKKIWDGGSYVSDWGSYVDIGFYKGDQTSADNASQRGAASLVSNSTKWTDNHKLLDTAYMVVKLTYDRDQFSQGLPNISTVIRGKKVWHPNHSSPVWSQNPALCLRDYLTDTKYGLGESASNIASINTALGVCDEPVDLAAGGTQLRYTLNGIVDTANTVGDNIEQMLGAMVGRLLYVGGKFEIHAGKYVAPTITIDESMVVGEISVQTKQSRRNAYNAVKGVFLSEDDNYVLADYPAQISSSYATSDGEPLYLDMTLPFTTNHFRAQRIAKLALLRSRQQEAITIPCNLSALKFKIGDNIFVTNSRLGYSSKIFEVVGYSLDLIQGGSIVVNVDAVETASSIWDWTTSDEEVFLGAGEVDLYDGSVAVAPASLTVTPQGFIASDGTYTTSFNVSFPASVDAFVKHYVLEWKKQSDSSYFDVIIDQSPAQITGLETGSAYDVRIKAVNDSEVSSSYTTATQTIAADSSAPNAPSAVSASGEFEQITINWTNPTVADFSHVDVYRSDTLNGTYTLIGTSAGTNFTDTGLLLVNELPVQKFYKLRSVDYSGNATKDGSGNPVYSSIVNATTTQVPVGGIANDAVDTDQIADDAVEGPQVDSTTTILVGSGANTAAMSGLASADLDYRFWAGAQTPSSASFTVDESGAVVARDITIVKADGSVVFNSTDGFTDEAFSDISNITGTAVTTLANTLTDDSDLETITLTETTTLTVKGKLNSAFSGFSTASSSGALADIPDNLTIKLLYKEQSAGSYTTLASQAYTKTTGSPSSTQYKVLQTNFGYGSESFYNAEIAANSGAVNADNFVVLTGTISNLAGSSSGTTYLFKTEISTSDGSYSLVNKVTSSADRIIAITSSGAGFYLENGTGSQGAPEGDITAVTAGTNLSGGGTSGGVTLNLASSISLSNVTLDGYLRGPSTFTIDPAAYGDDTGTLVIAGNLQVDGTTTTINSTTVNIEDLNVQLASDAANASAANGAGITVGGANAELKYIAVGDKWTVNKTFDVAGSIIVSGAVDGRDIATDGGKLDGIEASADVTDATNVTAAGALMDSELTSIASVKALNQGVATTDSPTFVDVTATSLDISGNIDSSGNVTIGSSSLSANASLKFQADTGTFILEHERNSHSLNLSDPDGTGRILRIDTSGNLMLGTTSSSPTSGSGFSVQSIGRIFSSVNGGYAASLNRGTSDGEILRFRKDGLTVASMGTYENGLLIGTTEGSDAFLKFESNAIRPATSTGGYRDAAIDLGHTSSRFKDLYLSGTISSEAISSSGSITTTGNFINNTHGGIFLKSNTSEANNWLFKENAANWGIYYFNAGSEAGATVGAYTTLGAEYFFTSSVSGYGPVMPSTWTGTQSGSYLNIMLSPWKGYIYAGDQIEAKNGYRLGGTTVIDASRNVLVGGNLHFNSATNSSFIGPSSTANIRYGADGIHQFDTYNGGWATRAQITDTNLNLGASVGFQMNGTTVIDASRNLTNIGTISSGAITSTGDISANSGKVRMGNPTLLSGRSSIRIDSDGDSFADLVFGDNVTSTSWANANWAISSRSSSESNSLKIYRGTGQPSPYNSEHVLMEFKQNNVVSVNSTLQINNTTVIDASRNLTNIGTISSGAITSTGNLTLTADAYITNNTSDGSDNGSINISGGGAFGDTRGASLGLAGNENGNGGMVQIRAGQGSYSQIRMYSGGTERVRMDNGGLNILSGTLEVGSTTVIDASRNLTNIGTISSGAITSTGNVTAYSDERLKSDIHTLDGKKVLQMRGVSFTKDGKAGSGVIAQELEKVAPELVHDGEEYKSVAYGNITGYLIEAVKEQQKEIDELKSLVKQLLEK